MMRKTTLRRVLAACCAALVVVVAGAMVFVYSGIFDVAATKPHLAPVYYVLELTMRRSIARHSAEVSEPEVFDAARVASGLPLYREHCVKCHGAPGVAPDAEAFGLYPPPPNLVHVSRTWRVREIFHTIRHGIKMTGMPAWQYRLSDDDIWSIVAFLRKLPDYSPADYARLSGERPSQAAAAQPVAARNESEERPPDAAAGRRAIDKYLCVTCHRIPRVTGADKDVGPPLAGLARRRYIAGSLLNTPENMAQWLEHPQRMRPGSAMPELGVNAADARDIAAFLYTLD